MYVTKFTDDYDNITDLKITNNCTNNENIFDGIIPTLLLTIPCGLSFLYLMSLMVYTLIKPLFNNKRKTGFCTQLSHSDVKFFGSNSSRKSALITDLILNIFREFEKVYIYSASLHQDFYRKLRKCSSNYIPIHMIPNILNEEVIDVVIDEIVNDNFFSKIRL